MDHKKNIAQYLIMNSPPGEIRDVIRDVKKVLRKDAPKVLDNTTLMKIYKDYHIKMLTAAPNPKDETYCLTSQYGFVKDNEFVDPNTGTVLRFDYKKETWTAVSEKKLNDSPVRDAIQNEMDNYAEEHYLNNKCVPLVYAGDDKVITICLSARNLSLSNWWSGVWKAVYTVNVKSSGQTKLKGTINVIAHYFEDGNIQLHTNSDQEANVVVSNPKETASAVKLAIKKIEQEFHESLEKMYMDMYSTTFKTMRRFLPRNRQIMNWDLGIHLVNEEIDGSSH